MTIEEKAASLDRDAIVALLVSHEELVTQVKALQAQVAWFKSQLFGKKSEKRLVEGNPRQASLGEAFELEQPSSKTVEVDKHSRRVKSGGIEDEDSGFRFAESVPVEEIRIENPALEADGAEVISEKVTYKLAYRPGVYVLLKYVRPVVKSRDGRLSCPAAPNSVLGKSLADVSLVAGVVIDKMVYHLPLYRQHQRMQAAGVKLARSMLTNIVHRAADLLRPVYEALLASILESRVLAMDETPIRAGRKKSGRRMNTGYFWPIYGDRDEVVFPFAPTRAHQVVRSLLGEYSGTLLTDGYPAYARYASQVKATTHAQCWSHTRRQFVNAEDVEPALSARALDLIGELYAREGEFRRKGLDPKKLIQRRSELCRPVVQEFFSWLEKELETWALLPKNPFTKAANYALERRKELAVFLSQPEVPLDTNHLERQIRPIALGRRNWLFAWTEIGAEYVGILQSLLATCRLQGISPYRYLVDVLQRIDTHPASEVALLTPRLWKENFSADPILSPLERLSGRRDA